MNRAHIAALAAALALAGCASGGGRAGAGSASYGGTPARLATPALTRGWSEPARDAAAAMEMKYGLPAETAAGRLVWNRAGQWKRIVVYDQAIPHAFPKPHMDALEQTIDYRVPVALIDDLAAFDGSITVSRTSGELSVRCGSEALNFLTLNLAHDIVMERRTAPQARLEFARLAAQFEAGGRNPYTDSLAFRVPADQSADPDRPAASGQR